MKKHFTATAYIIAKLGGEYKVLLHKHNKLNVWIAIGGHVEDGENPYQTVLKEVKEETNLDIKIISADEKNLKTKYVEQFTAPAAMLEEFVPTHKKEKEHIHIDCIYFAFCKNPKKLKMDAEFVWSTKKDLKKMNLGKEVVFLAKNALELFK